LKTNHSQASVKGWFLKASIAAFKNHLNFDLLSNRSFLLLWVSGAFSRLGDAIFSVALPWLIVEQTKSASALSFLFFAQVVPALIFGFHAGVLADRFNRKRLLIVGDLARFVILAMFLFFYTFHQLSLAIIYLGAVLLSTFSLYYEPTRAAVLPQLVKRDDLSQANAWLTTARNAVDIAGKAAGGFLLASFGAAVNFGFDGFTFLISGICLAFLLISGSSVQLTQPIHKALAEGFGYLMRSPSLVRSITTLIIVNLAVADLTVSLPLLAVNLSIGSQGLGFALALLSLGGTCGGLLLTFTSKRISYTVGAFSASLGVGILLFFVSLFSSPIVLFTGLFLLGGAFAASLSFVNTLMQMQIPPELLGRVMALRSLTLRVFPTLFFLVSGLIIPILGLTPTLTVIGVFVGLSTTVLWWFEKGPRSKRSVSN